MYTINERFRWLLKELNLSQESFAKGANRTRSEISNIVYNKTVPKNEVIQSVCDAYNVSSEWLRNGTGDPFVTLTREAQLTKFVGEAMRGESPSDQQRFLYALRGATPEELHAIANFAKRLAAEYAADSGDEKKGDQ